PVLARHADAREPAYRGRDRRRLRDRDRIPFEPIAGRARRGDPRTGGVVLGEAFDAQALEISVEGQYGLAFSMRFRREEGVRVRDIGDVHEAKRLEDDVLLLIRDAVGDREVAKSRG